MSDPDYIDIPTSGTEVPHSSMHAEHECLVCGRGLSAAAVKRGTWVEMTTSGKLVRVGVDAGEHSQGCFPVGPRCKRLIPKAFRLKMKNLATWEG